jgi:REP element-mobilizing transposase RayT
MIERRKFRGSGDMRDNTYHHRRYSIRLPGYDYSQNGAYFVTLCTQGRECLFGDIIDGAMRLNEIGELVEEEWRKTAIIRNEIELDEWVIMPNHIHGILIISQGRGTARRAPTFEQFGKPVPGSIPTVIRSFKSAVTKRSNIMRGTSGVRLWQRNYYEIVIRNEDELNHIRRYIIENPTNWNTDRENP